MHTTLYKFDPYTDCYINKTGTFIFNSIIFGIYILSCFIVVYLLKDKERIFRSKSICIFVLAYITKVAADAY